MKTRFQWRYVVLTWLLISVPLLWFHYAIGQNILRKETAHSAMNAAAELYRAEKYEEAEAKLLDAQQLIPADDPVLNAEHKTRLALTKLKQGKLTEASNLITETAETYPRQMAQLDLEVREALGAALYYRAWFQRVSGVGRNTWEPHAVRSRQAFRYLNEKEDGNGDYLRNLECAVRLSRMDLDDLYEFPLPPELEKAKKKESECNNPQDECGECDNEGECDNPGNKKQKKKGKPRPKDVRDRDDPQRQGGLGAPDLSGS